MWARGVTILLGLWLMVAPAMLGYAGAAAASDRIIGPLAASVATIALTEVMRPLRWVNLGLGFWLLAAPWVLGYATAATLNSSVVGLSIAVAATVRGRIQERFGGGWLSLWRADL
jgi:hypothetical protein